MPYKDINGHEMTDCMGGKVRSQTSKYFVKRGNEETG